MELTDSDRLSQCIGSGMGAAAIFINETAQQAAKL